MTKQEIINGRRDRVIKGFGFRSRDKGQSKLGIPCLPVMKGRNGFVVYKVSLHVAVQDNLSSAIVMFTVS